MGEPTRPRNRDQDIPTRSGEEMGEREPLTPQPGSEHEEPYPPGSEEESYERGREKRRPAEEKPPVED
jgi:hypothetical protein